MKRNKKASAGSIHVYFIYVLFQKWRSTHGQLKEGWNIENGYWCWDKLGGILIGVGSVPPSNTNTKHPIQNENNDSETSMSAAPSGQCKQTWRLN